MLAGLFRELGMLAILMKVGQKVMRFLFGRLTVLLSMLLSANTWDEDEAILFSDIAKVFSVMTWEGNFETGCDTGHEERFEVTT